MGDVIDLIPRPSDDGMEEIIRGKIESHQEFLEEILEELEITKDETCEAEQPFNFTYAKLLKYLKEGITQSQLIKLCAASVWRISTEQKDEGGT